VCRSAAARLTFAAVSALCLIQLAPLDHNVTGGIAALIALYTVFAYADPRTARRRRSAPLPGGCWARPAGRARTAMMAVAALLARRPGRAARAPAELATLQEPPARSSGSRASCTT
jgi:hypothetical protein